MKHLLTRRSVLGGTIAGVAAAPLLGGLPSYANTPARGSCELPLALDGLNESLGSPFTNNALSPDQSLGVGREGQPLAFFFPRGNDETTSEVVVYDIRAQKIIFTEHVPRGHDSWAVTFSHPEKAAYFGTTNPGVLYRYIPGTDRVEDLGIPLSGQFIWSLDAAPDGTILGGSYPDAHLWTYSPQSGEVRDYGQILDSSYAMTMAANDTTIWVGTKGASRGRLAAVDRATGSITEIPLPAGYKEKLAVYDIALVREDRLAVRTEGTSQADTALHFYDLPSATWLDTVDDVAARKVSSVDPRNNRDVYFRMRQGAHSGQVVRYDLDSGSYSPVGWAPNAITGDWLWVQMDEPEYPGWTLALTNYNMGVRLFNPDTGARRTLKLGHPGAPVRIAQLDIGPDQKIYLSSQAAQSRWNQASEAFEHLQNRGGVQGYGVLGPHLLMGKYPGAGLQAYDTTKPWVADENPAPSLLIGEQQDRPLALTAIDDSWVAVGTAPESSTVGGGIALWRPVTDELRFQRNVIPDQSVVSLVRVGDLVWGGTSINGGYGVPPKATGAKLFAFDPTTERIVYDASPFDSVQTISALTFHDGLLWGNADGTLFSFDPAKRAVEAVIKLEHDTQEIHGRNRGIVVDSCGRMFAVTQDKLYFIDTEERTATVLVSEGVRDLAINDSGQLFYRAGHTLMRFTPTYSARAPKAPAWEAGKVYHGGDKVTHGGRLYEASWWTKEEPGKSVRGSWQEIAVAPDGTALWTPSRIFNSGDRVWHGETAYVAKWWTRNQKPGDPRGPWRPVDV